MKSPNFWDNGYIRGLRLFDDVFIDMIWQNHKINAVGLLSDTVKEVLFVKEVAIYLL